MRFTTSTLYELCEEWTSPLPQSAVLKMLTEAFDGDGARIRREDDRVEVRLGSNWRYRFWGNLFTAGRTSLPVAVEFRTSVTASGTSIAARAFDTFGFRLAGGMYFGAGETFMNRLEDLLGKAAAALGVERPQ